MVQQITKGIRICVKADYEGCFVQDRKLHYAFVYAIIIENQGKETVQLISRYWSIKDSLKNPTIVQGEGVVGEKPVLSPGEKHSYTSRCLLVSPIGAMSGHYVLINTATSQKIEVPIPLFNLSAEFALN